MLRGSIPSGNEPTIAIDRAEINARCILRLPSIECVLMTQTITFGLETVGVSHKT